MPRFVSLKPDRVNVHGGPTRDHEVTFVYTRAGLPVEITAEFDNWRRIRDWEGSEGWVYHSLLSGKRTVLVSPKDKNQLVALRDKADTNSAVVAQLQAGVMASVKRCSGSWCRITGARFDGWVVQEQLWACTSTKSSSEQARGFPGRPLRATPHLRAKAAVPRNLRTPRDEACGAIAPPHRCA